MPIAVRTTKIAKARYPETIFVIEFSWALIMNGILFGIFQISFNRPYARKIKLAEFSIKQSGTKSYLENTKGKPGNPGV